MNQTTLIVGGVVLVAGIVALAFVHYVNTKAAAESTTYTHGIDVFTGLLDDAIHTMTDPNATIIWD